MSDETTRPNDDNLTALNDPDNVQMDVVDEDEPTETVEDLGLDNAVDNTAAGDADADADGTAADTRGGPYAPGE